MICGLNSQDYAVIIVPRDRKMKNEEHAQLIILSSLEEWDVGWR
jgi:hypothetical protein